MESIENRVRSLWRECGKSESVGAKFQAAAITRNAAAQILVSSSGLYNRPTKNTPLIESVKWLQ